MLSKILGAADKAPLLKRSSRSLRKRLYLPTPESVRAAIDSDRLAELQRQLGPSAEEQPPGGPLVKDQRKYLYPDYFIPYNIRRIETLGLHGRPPLRILDLGCGPGYFLKVLEMIGHQAIGVDIDESEIFRHLIPLLGVRRVICRIEPLTPMPVFPGAPFDLVTAYAICFNNHGGPGLWDAAEWDFFIADVFTRHLAPKGQLHLVLNPEPDQTGDLRFYTPTLLALFKSRGAVVDGPIVTFQAP